jgi:hypothetical protein
MAPTTVTGRQSAWAEVVVRGRVRRTWDAVEDPAGSLGTAPAELVAYTVLLRPVGGSPVGAPPDGEVAGPGGVVVAAGGPLPGPPADDAPDRAGKTGFRWLDGTDVSDLGSTAAVPCPPEVVYADAFPRASGRRNALRTARDEAGEAADETRSTLAALLTGGAPASTPGPSPTSPWATASAVAAGRLAELEDLIRRLDAELRLADAHHDAWRATTRRSVDDVFELVATLHEATPELQASWGRPSVVASPDVPKTLRHLWQRHGLRVMVERSPSSISAAPPALPPAAPVPRPLRPAPLGQPDLAAPTSREAAAGPPDGAGAEAPTWRARLAWLGRRPGRVRPPAEPRARGADGAAPPEVAAAEPSPEPSVVTVTATVVRQHRGVDTVVGQVHLTLLDPATEPRVTAASPAHGRTGRSGPARLRTGVIGARIPGLDDAGSPGAPADDLPAAPVAAEVRLARARADLEDAQGALADADVGVTAAHVERVERLRSLVDALELATYAGTPVPEPHGIPTAAPAESSVPGPSPTPPPPTPPTPTAPADGPAAAAATPGHRRRHAGPTPGEVRRTPRRAGPYESVAAWYLDGERLTEPVPGRSRGAAVHR